MLATVAEMRRVVRRLRERVEFQTRTPPRARPPFGVEWLQTYLPHYVKDPLSQLHRDLAADLADLDNLRGQRRCYVAPRGSAKTTWLSKAYPLRSALEGREPLTLLLAETGGQSAKYLDSIKRELETNPAIRRDYPDAAGKGPVWQSTHIRLRNGCEIAARGAGGRILGITAQDRRPTLVVVDDGNERADAYSPLKRSRKLDWLVKDVLPAGEPTTNFVLAGTPIHREALICAMRQTGWPTRSYSALTRAPDRLDLWEECSKRMHALSDPDREHTARAFYEANRTAMDAGAELLWPERLTLFDLMMYRARYGEAAFRTEYTSDPGSAEGAEWPAEYFDRPDFYFNDWPDGITIRLQSLDPSKGTDAKSNDYQAHVMLGFWPGPKNENLLYVDAELRREPDWVSRALDIAAVFNPQELVAESNSTMGLLLPEFRSQMAERARTKRGPSQLLRVNEVHHTSTKPKLWRIRALTPYLAHHQVRVRNTPGGRMLVEQMRDVPNGEYDDGPDSLATGVLRLEEMFGLR